MSSLGNVASVAHVVLECLSGHFSVVPFYWLAMALGQGMFLKPAKKGTTLALTACTPKDKAPLFHPSRSFTASMVLKCFLLGAVLGGAASEFGIPFASPVSSRMYDLISCYVGFHMLVVQPFA